MTESNAAQPVDPAGCEDPAAEQEFRARLAAEGEPAPAEPEQNPIATTAYDYDPDGSVDGEPETPVGNGREDRTSAGR